jgi:hypothetical protein
MTVRTTQHGFPQSFDGLYADSFCTADPYRAAFMVYCGLRLFRYTKMGLWASNFDDL